MVAEIAIDPTPYLAARPPADLERAVGRPLVGFVGRLAPQKGVRYLLQAAGLARAAGAEFHLLLVGEGDEEPALRALIGRLGLNDRVTLAGYRPDVPQVLAALDLFVLPSLYEGLPLTLLEAMAVGRPVIATDVPGNRDPIRHGETGWLVPSRDPAALAAALGALLADPGERERLGRNARAAALARPTVADQVKQIAGLYREVLARKGGLPG